jgi:hypothetical protein
MVEEFQLTSGQLFASCFLHHSRQRILKPIALNAERQPQLSFRVMHQPPGQRKLDSCVRLVGVNPHRNHARRSHHSHKCNCKNELHKYLPFSASGSQQQSAATKPVSAQSMGENIPQSGKWRGTKDAELPPTLVGGLSVLAQTLCFVTLRTSPNALPLGKATAPSIRTFRLPVGYASFFS